MPGAVKKQLTGNIIFMILIDIVNIVDAMIWLGDTQGIFYRPVNSFATLTFLEIPTIAATYALNLSYLATHFGKTF
jgi:hypothetical protein